MGEMPSNYTPKIKWMTIKAEVIGRKKERLLPRQLITLVAQAKVYYYSQGSFQTSKRKESHSRVKAEKQTTKAKTTKEEHEIN